MRVPYGNWTYPLEAVRDRYVTRMGGVSYDLQPGQMGVHARALERNTSLVSNVDEVLVSAEGPVPVYVGPRDESFTVVALDDRHGDARRLSPHGEVVFSAFETDSCGARCVVEKLRQGDAVFLNATLTRFPAPRLGSWMDARKAEAERGT